MANLQKKTILSLIFVSNLVVIVLVLKIYFEKKHWSLFSISEELEEESCGGFFDKKTQTFKKFNTRERLECKINQFFQIETLLDKESFYYTHIDKELWRLALSDDKLILNEFLNQFSGYNNISILSSISLIQSYLDWKTFFMSLDSPEKKKTFLISLQDDVDFLTQLMQKEQAENSLKFLDRGFDHLYLKINPEEDVYSL